MKSTGYNRKEATERILKIVSVVADELKSGNFKYSAIYQDGTKEVIRKSATRLYQNAFGYLEEQPCSSKPGLGDFFTFGIKAASGYGGEIKSFPVLTFDPDIDPEFERGEFLRTEF
tara:strand:+ start:709 stop:1056 length:348 start_codon:yes stop_codon:yes gene_type:complete